MVGNVRGFTISRVEHTGITVASLDEALKFWVEIMGFDHLYTWEFENSRFLEQLVGVNRSAMRLAMVQGPGHMLELLEYTAPPDRAVLKPRSCDVGSLHLAFHVDDIEAAATKLASVGWRLVGEIQTIKSGDRAGLRLAYIRGPDGLTLEFLQQKPDPKGDTK
jgi:catechol 2,3-dioxygenase-like lactoylglutathione lyase family enzyme